MARDRRRCHTRAGSAHRRCPPRPAGDGGGHHPTHSRDHRLQPEQPDRSDRHAGASSTSSVAAVPADILIILDEAYAEFVTDPDAVDGMHVLGTKGHPTSWRCAPSRRRSAWPVCASATPIGHPRILDAARSTSIPLSVTAQAEEAALASLDAEEALLERVKTIARAPGPARGRAARERMAGAGGAGQLRLASRRRRDTGGRRRVRRGRTHRAAVRRRRHLRITWAKRTLSRRS